MLSLRTFAAIIAWLMGTGVFSAPGLSDPAGPGPASVKIVGEAEVGQEYVVQSPTATFALGEADATDYRVTVEVKLAPTGPGVDILALPAEALEVDQPAAGRITFGRGQGGASANAWMYRYDPEAKKWVDTGFPPEPGSDAPGRNPNAGGTHRPGPGGGERVPVHRHPYAETRLP